MKFLGLIGLVLITVLLQVSFLPALRPIGIVPNLALIVVLYSSVELAASEALAVAVGIGVLLDLVSGADFGLRTAFLSFFGLLVILIRRTGADFTRLSMVLAAVVSAGMLWNAAVLASVLVSHDTILWGQALRMVGIETGINCLIVLVVHAPIRWLLQNISGRQPVVAIRG